MKLLGSVGSLPPSLLQWLSFGQAEARVLETHPGPPCKWHLFLLLFWVRNQEDESEMQQLWLELMAKLDAGSTSGSSTWNTVYTWDNIFFNFTASKTPNL